MPVQGTRLPKDTFCAYLLMDFNESCEPFHHEEEATLIPLAGAPLYAGWSQHLRRRIGTHLRAGWAEPHMWVQWFPAGDDLEGRALAAEGGSLAHCQAQARAQQVHPRRPGQLSSGQRVLFDADWRWRGGLMIAAKQRRLTGPNAVKLANLEQNDPDYDRKHAELRAVVPT